MSNQQPMASSLEDRLLFASRKGTVEEVKKLLAAGAKVNAFSIEPDNEGETALSGACSGGHLDVVVVLLNAGADPNPKRSRHLPLVRAASNGFVAIVEKLVDAGANLEKADWLDTTPLIRAAANLEMTRVLLKLGANVNTQTKNGKTALMRNCFGDKHDLNVVKELVEAGANLNLKDRKGDTALDMAADIRARRPTFEYLKSVGAKLGKDVTEEQTPPQRANKTGQRTKKARWGLELPKPNLSAAAVSAEYKSFVENLDRRLEVNHSIGPNGLRVYTLERECDVAELQRQLSQFLIFALEPGTRVKIGVFPTADKGEAIAAMQTNGQNYGIGPSYIVEWLRKLDAEQPFILTGVGLDFVAGRFLSPVKGAAKLAKRMYDFCPDAVDQGHGSVEALADALKTSQEFGFWWD